MPKSHQRLRETRPPAAPSRSWPRVAASWGALVVVLAGGAFYWWRAEEREAAFQALAATGQAGLADVVSPPDRGRGHLGRGELINYRDPFPTSGPHDPVSADPGYYDDPPSPSLLVHSLEHGHIVIYADRPGEAAEATLRAWSGQFRNHWGGVIVVRRPGLGGAVVLTAWNKRLRQERFDAATAAAFVDAYRGRGPENPIR